MEAMGFVEKLQQAMGNIGEGVMQMAGLSEQENGQDGYPYATYGSAQDKPVIDGMVDYYSRGIMDKVAAVKALLDVDGNLLCAVISKGTGGTSYFYELEDSDKIAVVCSPMTIIDLAMHIVELQKEYTIVSWGALTADFRFMYERGFAQDEWAAIAANHIDMLYHLRSIAGSKINLQAACISMGVTAVEQDSRSFKIEEAIKQWKHGIPSDRVKIMDSMRSYCKLLIALYGAVATKGAYLYKPKDSALIEQAVNKIPMEWSKVSDVYNEQWVKKGRNKKTENSEEYVSMNVMHNWLVEHADRSKKTLQSIIPPAMTLNDLIKR